MIDKTILIQIKAFFCCYIQNLRWLYVALCICCNKLRILAKVTHAVCCDLPGQCHWNNFFSRCDKTARLIHDIKNRCQTFFYNCKPPLIHYLMKDTIVLTDRVVSCLNNFKQILEIPIIFQSSFYFIRIFCI